MSSAPFAKNMAGRTNHTVLMTVAIVIPTVLLSKGMGVQEAHKGRNMWKKPFKESVKRQILLR
jgi:hypothetical protein